MRNAPALRAIYAAALLAATEPSIARRTLPAFELVMRLAPNEGNKADDSLSLPLRVDPSQHTVVVKPNIPRRAGWRGLSASAHRFERPDLISINSLLSPLGTFVSL
jgi:hypothetical protein